MFLNFFTSLAAIVWDIDPVLIHIGPISLRYYGLLFALALAVGYMIIRWRYKDEGEDPESATNLTYAIMIAVVVGARLGHCLFYEPDRYLADPVEILKFWHGGLASHGAAAGIILTCICYDYFFRRTPIRMTVDRLAYTIPFAMVCVRLGNFFNSEIVGKPCDPNSPLAFIFPRYDNVPRYPSQLFEVGMGLVAAAIIYGVHYYYKKRGKKRPLGLQTGLILMSYMGMRFLVEFFKEYQDGEERIGLDNGQIFSIPFFCIGLFMVGMSVFGPWKKQTATDYNGRFQIEYQKKLDALEAKSAQNAESNSAQNAESSSAQNVVEAKALEPVKAKSEETAEAKSEETAEAKSEETAEAKSE